MEIFTHTCHLNKLSNPYKHIDENIEKEKQTMIPEHLFLTLLLGHYILMNADKNVTLYLTLL